MQAQSLPSSTRQASATPRTFAVWLGLLACLIVCGLWRQPVQLGTVPPALRLGILVAAALAGLGWFAVAARMRFGGFAGLGAALVGAALCCGGGAWWLRFSTPVATVGTPVAADHLLMLHAALLLAGLLLLSLFEDEPSPFGHLADAAGYLALGLAAFALYWWLFHEPQLANIYVPAWPRVVAVVLGLGAFATIAARTGRVAPVDRSMLLLCGGAALLCIGQSRLLWLSKTGAAGGAPGTAGGLALAALLILGPLLFLGVAFYLWRLLSGKAPAPAEEPVVLHDRFLPFAMTWLAVTAGAWHFGTLITAGKKHEAAFGEIWWLPILVALAALFAMHQRGGDGVSAPRAEGSASQLRELQAEVALRTQQLTTLHTVTANINTTLNAEQVLTTGLERMVEAVSGAAGAVWLHHEARALKEDDGKEATSSGGNMAALRRELERSAAERRALASIQGGGADEDGALSPERMWNFVHVIPENDQAQRTILFAMHAALEEGELAHALELCRSRRETFGYAHIAAITFKDELLGAVGITRATKPFSEGEILLLDALGGHIGAAMQNAQMYQEAIRLTDRDGLTDLYNHRAIQGLINSNLARARRISSQFSVVLMDLSNFRFFNDTYGHAVGDKVLCAVADCLREVCRAGDIVGRFGGDEFIALLPDTGGEGAIQACRRIVERVQHEGYQQANDNRRIPIQLAFGLAVFPHDGATSLELLATANSTLDSAKTGGSSVIDEVTTADQSRELRRLRDVSKGGSFGVLDALVTAIDNKDHYTRRHSEDVSYWATLMAGQLEFSEETQQSVRICGILHDVGKIAVPDAVLRKPGRLNDDEFHIMQQHPVFGALIVKDVPNLTEVLGGIRNHHERFDGKGYPDKLAGEKIPMMGRLLAVPDCFSAMTTERPYRKALSWAEAVSEIEKGKGTQFDPVMADAFMQVIDRILTGKEASSPPMLEDGVTPVARPDVVVDAAPATAEK